MQYAQVSALIRAVRIERRLTQELVASKANICQQTVSRIERGDIGWLQLGTLQAVAGTLGISIELRGRWQGDRGDRLLDRSS